MELLANEAERLGVVVTPEQLALFRRYHEELMAWNRRVNLTRVTGREEVRRLHFLDSLTAVPLLDACLSGLAAQPRILDLGSGAGLPGIPIKLVRPAWRVILLDSTRKRTAFLGHLIGLLGLRDVEVVTARAEEAGRLPAYRERLDAVISRAVAPLSVLAELCLPFVRLGGHMIGYKKGDIGAEIERSHRALRALGGGTPRLHAVPEEVLPGQRCLVVVEKISATPETYPRRPGVPARRSL